MRAVQPPTAPRPLDRQSGASRLTPDAQGWRGNARMQDRKPAKSRKAKAPKAPGEAGDGAPRKKPRKAKTGAEGAAEGGADESPLPKKRGPKKRSEAVRPCE